MQVQPTLEEVRRFWNENPLFQGEIDEPVGSRSWYSKLDQTQIEDVFANDLSDLVHAGLTGKKILEVGCGPGFLSRQICKLDIDYTAIDLSEKSVELARIGQELFGLKGKFQLGNAESLEFFDHSFDHVISIGVIHHTPDTQKCVEEIYRILKPGGTGVVGLYCKNWLLKQNFLLRPIFCVMRTFELGLKGRGREKMFTAKDVSEFVRMYDGDTNPIGKSYTVAEACTLFSDFQIDQVKLYFFPVRAFRIKLPFWIHQILAKWFGFMVMIKVTKPSK